MTTTTGSQRLRPLLVNWNSTLPFLRSVAYAIVALRTTHIEWREETGPIRTLYVVLGGLFGTPGSADIRMAPAAEIERQVKVEMRHRLDGLLTKMKYGPAHVQKYLANMRQIRGSALEALRQLRADAADINDGVAREWGRGLRVLARTEFAATTGVKVLGQIPGPGWAVGLAYDTVHDTICDFYEAGHANSVVTIGTQTFATEGGKELADWSAEHLVDKLNGQPTWEELKHAITQATQLEDKIANQSGRAAHRIRELELGLERPGTRQSLNSLTNQISRNTTKLDAAQKGVVVSAGKAAMARAVSWVFVARDLIEAQKRYDTVTNGARR